MIITSIVQQKKNPKRYSIFIDDDFVFGLSDVDVLYFHLREGEEILSSKLNEIMENVVIVKARETALRFLDFKRRTKKEVTQKLREKEFSDTVIEKTIDLLCEYGYINDEEYTKDYFKDKMEIKNLGARRISYDLQGKGISRQIIDKFLAEQDFSEQEEDNVLLLIRKKIGNQKISDLDIKDKKKVYDFLARRGYSYGICKDAFEKIANEEDDEGLI